MGTLGSAFGGAQNVKQISLPMSAPCSPRVETPITRANSEPQVQTPAETETLEEPALKKRTLSVFTDENVKFNEKFKAGETLGVKAHTYKVGGVVIKQPCHNKQRKKWESVGVCKPTQPRRLSRCWRRNTPGDSPKAASKAVQKRRRSRSCPKPMKPENRAQGWE